MSIIAPAKDMTHLHYETSKCVAIMRAAVAMPERNEQSLSERVEKSMLSFGGSTPE